MRRTDCSEILKALSDRSRMRLVKTLLARDFGVNDLATALELSQYNVSKHLRVLKHAGIVQVRSVGTRREYGIAPKFRDQIDAGGKTLDFGCCTFRFDRLSS